MTQRKIKKHTEKWILSARQNNIAQEDNAQYLVHKGNAHIKIMCSNNDSSMVFGTA